MAKENMRNVSEASHKIRTINPGFLENLELIFDAAIHIYCHRTGRLCQESKKIARQRMHAFIAWILY